MEIETAVRHYIVENFLFGDAGGLTSDEVSLMDTGIIDSTGVMEILMFIEETYQLDVDDTELIAENFDSVAGIAGLVKRKKAKFKEQAY